MKRIWPIILCLLFVSPTYALTGISFGVKGGMGLKADFTGVNLNGEEIDRLMMIGGQIKISTLPFIDVIGTAEYGWKTLKDATLVYDATEYTVEYKVRDLAFTASVVYPLKMQVIKPFAGFGIGSHNLGYDVTANNLPLGFGAPEDKSYLGYHILAGIDISFPAVPLGLTGEFRYNWVDTPGETTKYIQLTVGANYSML